MEEGWYNGLNGGPSKSRSYSPEPVNVTFFRKKKKKVFENVIK